MKINMPVTNTEIMFDDTQFMLTKTDLKGTITYANQDFIEISGFSEAELVGQSHNLVRHPDMPVEAFEDMWRSLKSGKPWTGLVKNRTKNGDFYWVEANATPVLENGAVTGYLSVRRKPSRQQVESAADAYHLFKDGKAKGLSISDGQVVKNSLSQKLKSKFQNTKVGQRLTVMILFGLVALTVQALIGLYEISIANKSIKTIQEDRLIPTRDLGKIAELMVENRAILRTALSESKIQLVGKTPVLVLDQQEVNNAATAIEQNIETISSLWKAYMATYLAPEEKVLADRFIKSRTKFVAEGLKPAIKAMKAGDIKEAMKYAGDTRTLFNTAKPDIEALLKLQNDEAVKEFNVAQAQYKTTQLLTFAGLGFITLLLFWIGLIIARSITKPLNNAIDAFGKITSGNYSTAIDAYGNNELSKVLQSLKSMQTILSINEHQLKESAANTLEQSTQYENQLAAISQSTGVIEFSLDGKVIAANDIFLSILGYSRTEAIGQHHSTFVEPEYKTSAEYKAMWEKLNRGESITGQFMRIGKGGKEIWLEASYNPILNASGKPYKVVKYATDITEQKLKNADFEGQMTAIGKSQGVIEVCLDGNITKVNQVYLDMLGYKEHELLGKHVSMVLDPTFAKSEAYKAMWDKLVKGGTDAGQYKRIAKDGREVWIQASYNPIYDLKGKPFKIVNYTMDITEQKLKAADNAGQLAAISKIQGVIEFDLTGKIISVNENFANVSGYSEKEIIGNHHSMFVESSYKSSHEYKAFWERLGRGEAEAGQYKRIAKGGREVWLQASYNPIMDMNGKPFKVVKYATDITEQYNNAATLAEAVEETQGIIEGAKTGDLSSRVPLAGKTGAIASLCDGVNALMDKMTEVIVQVREAGDTINTAAGEISSGNNDLSQRTEQQASSLEETAASMEQLASTVKNNAENAKQANQLAASASGVAIKGGEVVGQVVSTMSAINSSAKKIEDIISVIDGIAFQTNILALNAAVEAARAGEQGRGFAVVAGEVRNLAQRSASAAKEIKELISDSVSKTAEGTAQVEQAGKTMQEIVSSVQRVTDIMGEITAASVEQSAGIDQVNAAVTSMDETTQQNAALVEQAAAAAESLVEQAGSLTDVVSAFKLMGSASFSGSQTKNRAPLRLASSHTKAKPAPKSVPAKSASTKIATKTGTNDDEWAEF
ncbi:PAS domain S-box protein [Methylotenera sp.]|uniref:PAS domain S-box protein n=1 Tax=Methylotenera sp. TaxID=2051956 RepID=UPI002488D544|nr:PAS domain S-box protein [Methylotenera sp.]MDI1299722.1 PAS domain S-box protein [Methylotenera sp.]